MKDEEAVFSPQDYLRTIAKRRGVPMTSLRIPERFLITYQRSAFETATQLVKGKPVEWWPDKINLLCIGQVDDVDVGVGHFRIGAPAAVIYLEEVIACGVKLVFEVGFAGGLQPFLKPGDMIVGTDAIRDEGTSFHYLPPDTQVIAETVLREALVQRLQAKRLRFFEGQIWTTDGVYRETFGKLRKFRNAGVLAVDMETSAIFAVAQYRNVKAASALVISDILTEEGWLYAFDAQHVKNNTRILLEEVLGVLAISESC
jgi:uridine phosphorylase